MKTLVLILLYINYSCVGFDIGSFIRDNNLLHFVTLAINIIAVVLCYRKYKNIIADERRYNAAKINGKEL